MGLEAGVGVHFRRFLNVYGMVMCALSLGANLFGLMLRTGGFLLPQLLARSVSARAVAR